MKERLTRQQIKDKQREKRARGTKAIVKQWELNEFVVHLSQVFYNKYVNLPQFLSRISQVKYDKLYPSGSSSACISGTPAQFLLQ